MKKIAIADEIPLQNQSQHIVSLSFSPFFLLLLLFFYFFFCFFIISFTTFKNE